LKFRKKYIKNKYEWERFSNKIINPQTETSMEDIFGANASSFGLLARISYDDLWRRTENPNFLKYMLNEYRTEEQRLKSRLSMNKTLAFSTDLTNLDEYFDRKKIEKDDRFSKIFDSLRKSQVDLIKGISFEGPNSNSYIYNVILLLSIGHLL